MQKSDATPGSLQNPVSDQFWDHFGRVPGGKIHPESQKRVPKVHAKKQQIFGSPKLLPRDGPRVPKGPQGSALGGLAPICFANNWPRMGGGETLPYLWGRPLWTMLGFRPAGLVGLGNVVFAWEGSRKSRFWSVRAWLWTGPGANWTELTISRWILDCIGLDFWISRLDFWTSRLHF